MDWFPGTIHAAIAEAKKDCKLFVVVVLHGTMAFKTLMRQKSYLSNIIFLGEENSDAAKAFTDLLASDEVTSTLKDVVAVKLINGSETCGQFSQLYPVLILPSIYFIDAATGVDLEVTGGVEITKEKLLESAKKAIAKKSDGGGAGSNSSNATVAAVAAAAAVAVTAQSPRGARVEEAQRELQAAAASPAPGENSNRDSSANVSLEDRVARAKRLLAERQAQKRAEDEEVRYDFQHLVKETLLQYCSNYYFFWLVG